MTREELIKRCVEEIDSRTHEDMFYLETEHIQWREQLIDILTRLLSKTRDEVDVERVWLDLCDRCRCHIDGVSSIVAKEDLAAAIKAAGGDK